MASAKARSRPAPLGGAATPTRLSGWCMDGQCLPSAVTAGCPETFKTAPDCACPCHRGKIPERAVKIARDVNRREAQRRAELSRAARRESEGEMGIPE